MQTGRDSTRFPGSGGLGKHVSKGKVIGPTTLAQYFAGAAGTATTLGANAKFPAELAHGADAIVGSFADFAVSDPVA
jgi:hypothetical protein